jgi:uncharacterized protein YjiS (DUF1127 family)
MTFQRQKLRQIEEQYSPTINMPVLDYDELADAIKRAHYLRSQKFVALAAAARRGAGKLIAKITAWNRRQRAAAALNRMSAYMLADIGLTRGDIKGVVRRGRISHAVDMQANATFVPEAARADIPVRHKYAA